MYRVAYYMVENGVIRVAYAVDNAEVVHIWQENVLGVRERIVSAPMLGTSILYLHLLHVNELSSCRQLFALNFTFSYMSWNITSLKVTVYDLSSTRRHLSREHDYTCWRCHRVNTLTSLKLLLAYASSPTFSGTVASSAYSGFKSFRR